jgi:hypothetical protein
MTEEILWHDFFEYSDGFLYWKVRPSNRVRIGQKAGSKTSHGYLMVNFQGKGERQPKYVHRIVWEMHFGFIPEGMVIDHINRNRSDNRIENLRVVTPCENTQTDDGKCVYFDARRSNQKKPWYARFKRNGKGFFKTFGSEQEAESWVASVRAVTA